MFRWLSKLLIPILAVGLAFGQQPQTGRRVVTWKPPFGGLNVQMDALSISDDDFVTFENGFVSELGEIVRRGALQNIDTVSISGTAASQVKNLYRFYKLDGTKRLVANFYDGIITGWYYLNDTTGRFAQDYTNTPDTISQLMYKDGTVVCSTGTDRVYNTTGSFFLNGGNRSFIKIKAPGSHNFTSIPKEVFIVCDTLLKGADGSTIDTTILGSTYELWWNGGRFGSAPYYCDAMSFLDTLILSRSLVDPIGWDGEKTRRLNVLDYGTADTLYTTTDSLKDSKKAWRTNEWTGMWLFKRKMVSKDSWFTYNTHWNKIERNSDTMLFCDSKFKNYTTTVENELTTGKDYAIVSLPVDEVLAKNVTITTSKTPTLRYGIQGVSLSGMPSYGYTLSFPLTAVGVSGPGVGTTSAIDAFSVDSIQIDDDEEVTKFDINSIINIVISRFPITRFLETYKTRTFWISDTLFPNTVWYSEPGRPGYIKTTSSFVIDPNDGDNIKGTFATEDFIGFGKEGKLYALIGNDPQNFQISRISDNIGVSSKRSIVQHGTDVWWYDWPRGIYSWNNGNPTEISQKIKPIIDSINASFTENVFGVYCDVSGGDYIVWGIPVGNATTPNRYIVYSPSTGAWSTWKFFSGYDVSLSVGISQNGGGDDNRVIFGLSDSGYVFRYDPTGTQDLFNGEGATNQAFTYVTTLESKRFKLPDNNGKQRIFSLSTSFTAGGTAASGLSIRLFRNQSGSVAFQKDLPYVSGLNDVKKSVFSSATDGYYQSWRLSTVSSFTFKLSKFELEIAPIGRRIPR